jgi:hypothetical protein
MTIRLLATPVLAIVLLIGPLAPAQTRSTVLNRTTKSLASIPFHIDTNLIFLAVTVNDSQPLSFILDTGSFSMISTSTAKRLGLDLQLVGSTNGIGDNQQSVYLVNGSPKYGPTAAVMSNQRLLSVPLEEVEKCFNMASADAEHSKQEDKPKAKRAIDGILGKEFFSSFVVEIDYDAKIVNVYSPAAEYRGAGSRFKIEIDPQHIFVRAKVKAAGRPPIEARLQVDTGYATAVVLTNEFVAENNLLPPADKLKPLPACGLAGLAKNQSWEGSLERLELGRLKIENPMTEFSQQPFSPGFDGFIGEAALMRFKVIFDYSRREMILEEKPKK